MSIKNLFGKSVTNYEEAASDVESTEFIDEVVGKRETYIPPVDFSDPANFAFYGSARLYYEAAIKRIYEDYPYDGSKAEQIEFEERSSFLERWLFENKYPKTTGYVQLGASGDIITPSGGSNFSTTNTPEYIRVWGGLHVDSSAETLEEHLNSSAKYDEDNNRNQNWNCDFENGITIEFWMKKPSFDTVNNPVEVLLDVWNQQSSTSEDRVLIYANDSIFPSSTLAVSVVNKGVTSPPFGIFIPDTEWNHYAISLYSKTGDLYSSTFLNGEEFEIDNLVASGYSDFSGKMDAFIGALQDVFAGDGTTGGGKFEGYLDEFRFWKTKRTPRQIKMNWFREIGGGANTDDATSDLGVYLKFNEGITGIDSIDSKVLDYSGRLANGHWEGYTTGARSTQSAIDIAGYSETPSPIIYSSHPDVVALETEMLQSGSTYDAGRGQAFYNSLPQWLVAEDELEGDENLRKLSHILSSYMDTLRVQMNSLSSLQDKKYTPDGYKATPFSSELLTNKGFLVSDMFLSAEVFETFDNIDYENNKFDLNIEEVKNLIYTNIYNNLENILSSKGTEKSIRNLIRCFGIDDELIKLNQYTDGGTQYLGDKYRTTSVKKKYINLNAEDLFEATMFQSGSRSFIDGSHASINGSKNAFTLEADILVPYKKKFGEKGFFATPFLSASVMGFHEANPSDNEDYTWWADNIGTAPATGYINMPAGSWSSGPPANDGETVEITSTNGTTVVYEFSSTASTGDILLNGNTAVEIGAALFNSGQNLRNAINGSTGHNGLITASYTYQLITMVQVENGVDGNTSIISSNLTALGPVDFTGGTSTFYEARDLQVYLVRDSSESRHAKFVFKNQTETIYEESDYVYDIYENEHYNVALRIKPQTYPYAGNVTNTTPDYDIELYAISHNFDEIKEEVLMSTSVNNTTGSAYMVAPKRVYAGAHYENFTGSLLHSTDLQFGRVSAWLDYLSNESIQEHNKDIMSYGPSKSIDGATAFAIDDIQVPSQELSILNWDFDTIKTSDASNSFIIEDTTSGSNDTIYGWIDEVIRREYKGAGKNFPAESSAFLENEFLYANKKQLPETSFNSNNIFLKGDQEIFFGEDDDVSDNLFVLEKSPSAIVSEEMLKLFSTTQEFSNLFGRHIDRYRIEYKDLARARQLYFEKAVEGIDFDKFFTYFKWIDSSISTMVNQLVPASVNFAGGVTDIIEPHILERDKYQRQVGLLQTVTSTEASMRGFQELNYNWRTGHAPIGGTENDNCLWQKERKERDTVEREQIREVIVRQNNLENIEPVTLSGSDGTYEGRTYATRRFSRPFRTKFEFSDAIHGGTNYQKTKDRDLLKSGIGNYSEIGTSGAPKNVVTFGAGDGYGLVAEGTLKCNDPVPETTKRKFDGFGILGKYTDFQGTNYPPLDPSLDYYSRRKISHIFLGNIVSSSVNTGYASAINKLGTSGGYKQGVNVVNLHSDTTDISNEIAIQGPFTERWIGGHQARHVELNSVGKPTTSTSPVSNQLDSMYSRPEAWRFLIGKNPLVNSSTLGDIDPDTDGAIGFTAPDYGIKGGSFPDTDRLSAVYYREERAKRPVNVKNIQTLTSSAYHGNYQHEYEVFSTFGDQGYFLKRAGNLLPEAISDILSETTNYHTLISQTNGGSGNYFGAGNNRQFKNFLETPLTNASFGFQFNQLVQPQDFLGGNDLIIERSNYIPNSGNNDTKKIIFYFDVGATNGLATETIDYIQIEVDVVLNDWVNTLSNFEAAAAASEISSYLSLSGTAGEYEIEDIFSLGDDGNGGSISAAGGMFSDLGTTFEGGTSSYELLSSNIIETQDRSTGSAHVIRTRFSAPSGPEVNSSGYLDVATQQYSVYNSLNFRNYTVRSNGSGENGTIRVNSHSNRREGLRTLLSRHQGQFGIDSQYGAVSELSYNTEASFHKQHRNTRKTYELKTTGSLFVENNEAQEDENNLETQTFTNGVEWGNSLTLSFWFKADSSFSIPVNRRYLLDHQALSIFVTGSSWDNIAFSFQSTPDEIAIVYDISAYNLQEWNHISFQYSFGDAGSEILVPAIYVNGGSIQTLSYIDNPSSTLLETDFQGGNINLLNNSDDLRPLSGGIGNLSIFSGIGSLNSSESDMKKKLLGDNTGDTLSKLDGFVNFWSLDPREHIGPLSIQDGDPLSFGNTFPSYNNDGDDFIVKSSNISTSLAPFLKDYEYPSEAHDNAHYTSLLPASDFQYSWINSAISGSNWEDNQKVLTYAPKNGLISSSAGITEALVFPSISSLYGE